MRILGHLLRGHLRLYQCYTSVNWRTCEACLSWHGRIVAHPEEFPAHESCPHEVLAFPIWKLGEHRKKGERMRAKATEEIQRREKWRKATALLPQDPAGALSLFKEAAQTDVYLPEVEELVEKNRVWLAENKAVRAALREILVSAWKAKFTKERYERQPELARISQEKFGLERLAELLP
ncbi:hypothetical protein H5T56_00265 [Candidatus Bipolaricaulota bacterium]|nr:hypothetical protein [Candidatus Bipolaricaulota bacterium]